MALLFIALGCISVIAMIGFRGLLLVALVAVGLMTWVGSRSSLFDPVTPQVFASEQAVRACTKKDNVRGLPFEEQWILCNGDFNHIPPH